MCGFAGFVGTPDRPLLERMGESVRHRGPDQDGMFSDAACSLAHKRLSIIDLSDAGRQPLSTSDGRFVIAYNGEIYNYQELRNAYASEGWTFRTQTDTECFLASAALHGLRDLDRFHGIFAIAVWDAKEQACYLARDRMGIKPLFWTNQSGRIAFASEVGSLLHLKPSWNVDEEARSTYFSVGYVPGPRTIFEGIRSLEPGRLFVIKEKKDLQEVSRFDAAVPFDAFSSRAEAREQLIHIVDRAVSDQLVSDRPVGVFLSGGLDSSVVLSSMRLAQPSGTIKTFTTRFSHDTTDPKFNRDAELAVRTAERYGCEHHEIEVSHEDVIHQAEEMAFHLGQPHQNHSIIALDAAAKLAAKHVPVVLSGDGGDESFGGYERYRLYAAVAPWLRNPISRVILRLLSSRDIFRAKHEAERLLAFHAAEQKQRRALFGDVVRDDIVLHDWTERLARMAETDSVARFMALDRETWLRDDAFVRSDRLSMRHGLELRVPLTDDALVSFAASLPRAFSVDARETKKLWREAFADRCLPEILNEPKRGWVPPHAKWLRSGLRAWSEEMLEEAIASHPWMNGSALRKAFQDHLNGAYHFQEIWTAISYHVWWKTYRTYLADAS